jgi:hypothetical protein
LILQAGKPNRPRCPIRYDAPQCPASCGALDVESLTPRSWQRAGYSSQTNLGAPRISRRRPTVSLPRSAEVVAASDRARLCFPESAASSHHLQRSPSRSARGADGVPATGSVALVALRRGRKAGSLPRPSESPSRAPPVAHELGSMSTVVRHGLVSYVRATRRNGVGNHSCARVHLARRCDRSA